MKKALEKRGLAIVEKIVHDNYKIKIIGGLNGQKNDCKKSY